MFSNCLFHSGFPFKFAVFPIRVSKPILLFVNYFHVNYSNLIYFTIICKSKHKKLRIFTISSAFVNKFLGSKSSVYLTVTLTFLLMPFWA